tara:strand:+ start:1042 stop:1593 length:552 start_codon:yes stop_codon:yes gene_type:complete
LQYLTKKKFTLSLLIIAFTIFCFLVLNKALNENKIYSPIFKNENETYLPDLNLPELFSSKEVQLSNIIKEKDFSLINIWASWCVPCREENNLLNSLRNISSLQSIGINYKDKKKNSTKFLNDYGNPFKYNLVDYNGTQSINLGAYGVPETFLINKNRKILLKIIGPINNNHVKQIRRIINEKG